VEDIEVPLVLAIFLHRCRHGYLDGIGLDVVSRRDGNVVVSFGALERAIRRDGGVCDVMGGDLRDLDAGDDAVVAEAARFGCIVEHEACGLGAGDARGALELLHRDREGLRGHLEG
jgi:hypothetical protein